MTVRKQHYYPRCLLKHFSDEKSKFFTYIRKAHQVSHLTYENICYQRDAYESDGIVDNILENKLCILESEAAPIINNIVDSYDKEDFTISESEIETLWRFMWLQYVRTDAGRILVMNIINNSWRVHPERTSPVDIEEIEDNKKLINEFNKRFKVPGVLEAFFNTLPRDKDMNFHIVIGDYFITSDNPVVGTDSWNQMLMPISPQVCLEFQHSSLNNSKSLILMMTKEKNQFINRAIINTANYFVMSYAPFDFVIGSYIYNPWC